MARELGRYFMASNSFVGTIASAVALLFASSAEAQRLVRPLTELQDVEAPASPTGEKNQLTVAGHEDRANGIEATGPSLTELMRISLDRHPKLKQAGFVVESARGRALQAGLHPNPIFTFSADEFGDRTGPAGILSPTISQEIVRGNKLSLSRGAVLKDVDRATWLLVSERANRLTAVRQAYYETLALQKRTEILEALVKLADDAVAQMRKLQAAKQRSALDVLQWEIEAEKFRLDHESAKRELPGIYQRLAAVLGAPELRLISLSGSLDAPLPEYELESLRATVLQSHPEIHAARSNSQKADLLLQRAEAERIPNFTVGLGYVRQSQNRSNDWGFSIAMPIGAWNRNQGNILAARADLGDSVQEIARVEADLIQRVATAFASYDSARSRLKRYRDVLEPKTRETYRLALAAFKAGELDNDKVRLLQRSVWEVGLDLARYQSDAWRAASEIAGLLGREE